MFTGIVEEVGRVTSVLAGTLLIAARDVLPGMAPGDSIAVNGACLTITKLNTGGFSVDIMPETLKRSNLGLLRAGDRVNLERPLALGGRLGGHLVQGHIDATGKVVSVRWEGESRLVKLTAPPEVMRYVVAKGFIAVDGISLTVVSRDAASFQVAIVDYTRRYTTLSERQVGDSVNLEVDIIAKYVEQLSQVGGTGVTVDFLQEHGFFAR